MRGGRLDFRTSNLLSDSHQKCTLQACRSPRATFESPLGASIARAVTIGHNHRNAGDMGSIEGAEGAVQGTEGEEDKVRGVEGKGREVNGMEAVETVQGTSGVEGMGAVGELEEGRKALVGMEGVKSATLFLHTVAGRVGEIETCLAIREGEEISSGNDEEKGKEKGKGDGGGTAGEPQTRGEEVERFRSILSAAVE